MKLEKYSDDVTTHIKDGKVEYIKFNALEKYSDKLEHFITLRHGGVSKFPFDTLNFKTNGKDIKENVICNLESVSKLLTVSVNDIYKATQNHTDNILIIDNKNKKDYMFEKYNTKNYDAYVVKDKGIATLVTTADCNPIIIYDRKNNIYANIHSGWKGTLKRIYIKAIKILVNEYKSNLDDLIICIGPSIRKCCFSSEEEEFKSKFTDIFDEKMNYIEYEANNKRFHIDLIKIITEDLIANGINKSNIHIANICTCCNVNDFFSFRYNTQKNIEDYGLMATIVNLKN